MRISNKDYLLFFWQLLSGFRVRHERMLAQLRQFDVESYFNNQCPLRILDLANGRLRPQFILLKATDHSVFGIDLLNQPGKHWSDYAYAFARKIYSHQFGIPTNNNELLTCGDVENLPFEDESFDLVTSIAAFEHFDNVSKVISEVHRVLRKGGVVWASFDPFSSPSGGHNINVMQIPIKTIPRGVDPWDHLRNKKMPFRVPLNQWRLSQYEDAFSKKFNIMKQYCALREGEHLLTPEIEAELAKYSREELTCGAYVIVARKPEN